jgi:hypothetical protein
MLRWTKENHGNSWAGIGNCLFGTAATIYHAIKRVRWTNKLSPSISAEVKVIINSHYYIQTCIILSSVWNGFEMICLLKLKMDNDSFRRDLTLFRLACYKQSRRKWVAYGITLVFIYCICIFCLASSCTWQCSRTRFTRRGNLKNNK